MKVSTERLENCLVALTVEIEPEEMEKAQEGAYRRLVNKVAVPGFRKGKDRPLNPYVSVDGDRSKGGKIFKCPSDCGDKSQGSDFPTLYRSCFDGYGNSYTYNFNTLSYSHNSWQFKP